MCVSEVFSSLFNGDHSVCTPCRPIFDATAFVLQAGASRSVYGCIGRNREKGQLPFQVAGLSVLRPQVTRSLSRMFGAAGLVCCTCLVHSTRGDGEEVRVTLYPCHSRSLPLVLGVGSVRIYANRHFLCFYNSLTRLPSWRGASFSPLIAAGLFFSLKILFHGPITNSGLPADGTMAAAVIYTIGDLHRPGCIIDYPKGGGGAVIGAMVRPLACYITLHIVRWSSFLLFGAVAFKGFTSFSAYSIPAYFYSASSVVAAVVAGCYALGKEGGMLVLP